MDRIGSSDLSAYNDYMYTNQEEGTSDLQLPTINSLEEGYGSRLWRGNGLVTHHGHKLGKLIHEGLSVHHRIVGLLHGRRIANPLWGDIYIRRHIRRVVIAIRWSEWGSWIHSHHGIIRIYCIRIGISIWIL